MSEADQLMPLAKLITSILSEEPEGLLVAEIRRKLLIQGRLGVQEGDIEKIIRLPGFRRLPGGQIVLEEIYEKRNSINNESTEKLEEPVFSKFPSTLKSIPNLESGNFVIFDTETNGLDANTADFFQLSAIKIENWQPVEIFNQYAKVDIYSITRALQIKLHFDDMALAEKINQAKNQNEVLTDFLKFCGELPLLAHNGTFDLSFIKKHEPNITNPLVDTLELFLLAYPNLASHSIENLADLLGFTKTGKQWKQVEDTDNNLGISSSLGIENQELFHSAIFDCLVLFLLFKEAITTLRNLTSNVKTLFRLLSDNLGNLVKAPLGEPFKFQNLSDLIPLHDWHQEVDSLKTNSFGMCEFSDRKVQDNYRSLLNKLHLEVRPSQEEMVNRVTNVFSSRCISMIEAPTGTGKTFAYLLPAIQLYCAQGEQVVISTSTKTLQDQVVHDLETKIKPNLSIKFDYTVLKGQENYLCLNRLWELIQETFSSENVSDIHFEEKFCVLYLLRFGSETRDGDLQFISYWLQQRFPILKYLKNNVSSHGDTCNPASACYIYCFYPRVKALAEKAGILIINHSLLLMRHWEEDEPKNLIIDEAHNLEDVATNYATQEASRNLIEQWLNRLLREDGKRGSLIQARKIMGDNEYLAQAMGCVRRIRTRASDLGGFIKDFIEKKGGKFSTKYGCSWRMKAAPRKISFFEWQYVEHVQVDILRELGNLEKAIINLYQKLIGFHGQDSDKAISLAKELNFISMNLFGTREEPGQKVLLEEIPAVGYDPLVMVHWIELGIRGSVDSEKIPPEKIEWAFKRAPVRVDEILQSKIYDKVKALVLTSATLSLVDGGFNFFLDRLGLKGYIENNNVIKLPNVFNYQEQVMLGMPGYMKSSARYDEVEAFQAELSRELSCFFRFTEGRGLVLHTARNRMEFVAQELEKNLSNLPIYWQREGMSSRLLQEEFSKREESVLLGLRSFWEGIDVPGPSLSYLVIEKLPFPLPNEPIIEARREQVYSTGGNEWMDFLVPLATLHFKQGFGRLMRKSDDRGVVLFMDKRLRSDTFYRESVLGSLPGYKRSDEIIESEESRPSFYEAVASHMSDMFPDLLSRIDLFPCINEEIVPDIEKIFHELELPFKIPREEYGKYRNNLFVAAQNLISGFQNFKEEQEEAIQSILSGEDTLVVLPTGSGKSLTFQLPALLRNGVTLVFSPLIALMRDQVEKLKASGLTFIDYIVSGQSGAHRDEVYRRMIKGQLRLVYIAPERVRDPALAEAVRNSNIIQVVIDEAHCVHMWGNSFRPDFLNIPNLFDQNSRPPFVALTATATKETRDAIVAALYFKQNFNFIYRTINRPELKFIVYNNTTSPERINSKQDKLRVLIKILTAARKNDEVALVYTSTVKEAEELSRKLNLNGFSVRYYHGKMTAQNREEVQELFREGIVKIIVATKAFGMGIDKSDVRYVIHYDIPGDIESYFQEAGRAGRDGQSAYCILLYHKSDLSTQQFFIQSAFPNEVELNSLLLTLRDLCKSSEPILIRPDDIADKSGVDIERIDLAIHLLEKMGFVHRSFNFTLMANILLNRSPRWISEKLPYEKQEILNQIIRNSRVSDKQGIQIDLLDLSGLTGINPIQIDKFFTELSTKGWAVYRPWDRGYILEPLEKLFSKDTALLAEADIRKLQQSMNRNLRRMMRYAESLGPGECRRKFILEYFGEDLNQKENPCCNLCDANYAYPWSEISMGELTEMANHIDPSYLTLRAIEWNDELRTERKSSPYTQKTLSYILIGNSYAATHKIDDPVKKLRRIKRLESSPYFGVLQGLKGGTTTIGNIFQRLEDDGLIKFETFSFNGSEDVIHYQAPSLTSQGQSRISSGKYIN